MRIKQTVIAMLPAVVVLWAGPGNLRAASVDVPNASFELPETVFADINIDSWHEAPKPWWYDESGGYFWSQLTGVFLNLPPGEPGHIDNCHGNQAVWLWGMPEVELFQDLAAVYEPGQAYHLTVGLFGGGGGMLDDVPIDIRLYYRDVENNRVPIGTTTVTYDADAGFIEHLDDVSVDIPAVKTTDPWAGKNIGIQLVSTLTLADPSLWGGYWDLDNVRLTKLPAESDFTGDSFVNFADFAMQAAEWRSCVETTTDLTDDGCVGFEDVMALALSWLAGPAR